MKIVIENKEYKVNISKKNQKNTYLRIKEDKQIYISTNKYVSDKKIKDFIEENKEYITKKLNKLEQKTLKEDEFYYLGKIYQIKNKEELKNLDKWYRKQAKKIFKERLDNIIKNFSNTPYPDIYIRQMKTRWGVCNRKLKKVTLNLELIKKDEELIDYVIIHELCHFKVPNHSKQFWEEVEKYLPNYKQLRKKLKQ